jgi:lysozyme
MTVSEDCINAIKQFEGFRSTAYKCPAGVWTIGYGHTGGVTAGMTISQASATL